MKNKIFFISSSMMPFELFLFNQINLLSKNYDVYLISNNKQYNSRIFNNSKIISIPISRNINLLYDIFSLIKLFSILLKFKPKLIISITPKGGLISVMANYFMKYKHLHFITGQNWINKKGIVRLIYKSFDKFTFHNSTSMLVDSKSQIKFLKSENFKTNKMNLIKLGSICGVSPDIFYPNKIFKYKERNKLKISNANIVILYLGRIHKEKGIFELYDVCQKLFNEGFDISLLLVGNIEDQKFYKILQKNNNFVSHYEHNDNPQKYMQVSDIFCIPSFREGFGLSVIEASSCELPILGTNISGLKDSIVNNYTGILFRLGDSNDLYHKLKKLIMDKNLRLQLGKNGRKRVISDFNQKDVVKFIDLHIQKIINS